MENKAADALSRSPVGSSLAVLSIPTLLDMPTITTKADSDLHLGKIKKELLNDHDSYPRFSLQQGKMLYKGRLVLARTSKFFPLLLQEFHSIPMGGIRGSYLLTRRS